MKDEFSEIASLRLPINEEEYLEFEKTSNNKNPENLTVNEFEDFVRIPELPSSRPRGQTSMRIDENVIWKFELIKRASQVFFSGELKNMPIIIKALFDTFFNVRIEGNKRLTHNRILEKVMRKLNKAYYYDGKKGEFFIPALTYNKCYVIRLLNLLFIEPALLTSTEVQILSFIVGNTRFNNNAVSLEKVKDDKLTLHELFYKSDLNFREVLYCFGNTSYPGDFHKLMRGELQDINSEIPSNELDLPSEEYDIFKQRYLKNKQDAEEYLEEKLKERRLVYKESIFWEPHAYKFDLVRGLSKKLGTLKFKNKIVEL